MKNRAILTAVLVIFIASLVFVAPVQALSNSLPRITASTAAQTVRPNLVNDPSPTTLLGFINKIIKIIQDELLMLFDFIGNTWDVIILALLVLVLFWVGMRVLNILVIWIKEVSGSIGPILIEEVKDSPEMAVLMRQYLTSCGVKFSKPDNISAPNDSPGFEKITTALGDAADIPQAKTIVFFLTALFQLIFFGPLPKVKAGYTVSCCLTGDESKQLVAIYVEVKYAYNGQIRQSIKLEGASNAEAAKKAAYWVFWYIANQKITLQTIPVWYRFPTSEGYEKYKDATVKGLDIRQANKLYQEAAKAAPYNALVLLGWGDLNETKNNYLEALKLYLVAILMWPFLYVFWYRISAIFCCPGEWVADQWNRSEDEEKQRLICLIKRLFSENKEFREYFKDHLPEVDEKADKEDFYRFASAILMFLEDQIQFKVMFTKWIKQVISNLYSAVFHPAECIPKLAGYYWSLIPLFWWQDGYQFLRSVQLANCCTYAQRRNGMQLTNQINSEANRGEWNGTISAVDTKQRTMTLSGDGDKVKFAVDEHASIRREGAATTLRKLKVGDFVQADYTLDHNPNLAVKIEANVKLAKLNGNISTSEHGKVKIIPKAGGSEIILIVNDSTSLKLEGAASTKDNLKTGDYVQVLYKCDHHDKVAVMIEAETNLPELIGKISFIGQSRGMVALEVSGTEFLFRIDSYTEIKRKDKAAKLDELNIGEWVKLNYDLVKKVEDIVKKWGNRMVIYYNAACAYALLAVNYKQYVPNAMKYLKIAYKDPKTILDLEWVQNDPDFKELKKDPEFSTLFDIPKELENINESEIEKERKTKLAGLDLLQEGAKAQQNHWRTTCSGSHCVETLIIEAEYQINVWESLIKFLENPEMTLYKESFWQLVMQSAKPKPLSHPKKYDAKTSLQQINTAWENITEHAKPQSDIWKKRLEDSKLFLQQEDSIDPKDILEMWKQSETWLWFYVAEQIKENSKQAS